MGFSDRWISWIMSCISTVTYSFNVSGQLKGFVTPERGIRQGDPLIYFYSAKKDSPIYCGSKVDPKEAAELKEILRKYEWGSGQMINLENPQCFLAKMCHRQFRRRDNCGRRMKQWQNKLPSDAGKEWGEKNGKKKIHWCSWHKLTQEKELGGLGFRDLQNFNRVMLGKQVWKLVTDHDSLVAKVLKAKYYPRQSIFICKVPHNASWIWQSLVGVREMVEKGTIKKIGNGKNIRVWEDRWIPEHPQGKLIIVKPQKYVVQKVGDLIHNFRRKRPLIFKLFQEEEAKKMLRIPISLANRDDCFFWPYSGNGQYTVAFAYKEISRQRSLQQQQREVIGEGPSWGKEKLWKHLWKLKLFIWKCMNSALPVNEKIYTRTRMGDLICKRCGEDIETLEHLFFHCRLTKEVWRLSPLQWDGLEEYTGNFSRWWSILIEARYR
ncbi:uncharacterized protein LOC113759861 [Coffea eugenioides]|uniref:uncharacterized protein LOC113759861 n=1 Tax=Coffea eugenioides TaxID=49369 RepID=UPI000F612D1D|nr:uncharacterized protein LOC113759861 [Coffea eugenioides]